MPRPSRQPVLHRLRWGVGSIAALAVGAAAAFIAGTAVAGPPSPLSVDKTAKVGTVTEAIAVASGSRAVYWLSGETTHHFLCTSSCFPIWSPVKAPKGRVTLARGLSGRLATVSRAVNGKKVSQLTLGGHPLYTFAEDKPGVANGDGLQSFGGTWHVVKVAAASGTTTTTTTPSTSTPSTTPTYTYPPGYASGY